MQSLQTVSQADFDAGENYVSIMKQNIEALRKGLN
jgi:ABC-type Zn uptake system ZnuABC Zn-binding protein ZnuA